MSCMGGTCLLFCIDWIHALLDRALWIGISRLLDRFFLFLLLQHTLLLVLGGFHGNEQGLLDVFSSLSNLYDMTFDMFGCAGAL